MEISHRLPGPRKAKVLHRDGAVRRGAVASLLVTAFLLPSALPAQVSGPETVVQPELVKVFETDSLYIWNPTLSPDGQWIVFSGGFSLDHYSLFAVPAHGGSARRLTEGRFEDVFPQWGPNSRWIYFVSNRVEDPREGPTHIMRIPFDPETGLSTDVPRPVVLDPAQRFAVSPDGQWIAYCASGESASRGEYEIRISPSTGGVTVSLGNLGYPRTLGWGDDGSYVLFSQSIGSFYSNNPDGRNQVWRISREGGTPEMLTERGQMVEGFSRAGDRILWGNAPGPSNADTLSWTDLRGRVLRSFTVPAGVQMGSPLRFEGEIPAEAGGSDMPVTLLPMAGGAPRSLSGLGKDPSVLGWLTSNRLLISSSEGPSGGRSSGEGETHYSLDVGSGSLSRVDALDGFHLRSDRLTLSQDGRWALFLDEGEERTSGAIQLVNLETSVAETLFRSPFGDPDIFQSYRILGRGGLVARDGSSLYYLLAFEDRRELYRIAPPRAPELVWTFEGPTPFFTVASIGIHGDWITWIESMPGEGNRPIGRTVMIGDLSTGDSRPLFETEGGVEGPLAWSNNGEKLALGFRTSPVDLSVAVLEVSELGELKREPRIFRIEASTWMVPRWLPGDESLAILAFGLESEMDTDILRIDLAGTGPHNFVNLTADNPYSIWEFFLSPDGRHIAYASERPATATLYRMRLPGG